MGGWGGQNVLPAIQFADIYPKLHLPTKFHPNRTKIIQFRRGQKVLDWYSLVNWNRYWSRIARRKLTGTVICIDSSSCRPRACNCQTDKEAFVYVERLRQPERKKTGVWKEAYRRGKSWHEGFVYTQKLFDKRRQPLLTTVGRIIVLNNFSSTQTSHFKQLTKFINDFFWPLNWFSFFPFHDWTPISEGP